jgi:hypothetical protein
MTKTAKETLVEFEWGLDVGLPPLNVMRITIKDILEKLEEIEKKLNN